MQRGSRRSRQNGGRWLPAKTQTKLVKPGTEREQERSSGMNNLSPKEVLVVDDEPLVRISAADLLVRNGIMAWEAADADEALHILRERPLIGVVLTDIKMPGKMNGLGLAEELSTLSPGIGIIVSSGQVALGDTILPDNSSFLGKPYEADHLVALVRSKFAERETA
jgi:DNA-binding NtrC family response regulator